MIQDKCDLISLQYLAPPRNDSWLDRTVCGLRDPIFPNPLDGSRLGTPKSNGSNKIVPMTISWVENHPQKRALCFFGYRAMSCLVVFRGNFCGVCGTSTPRRKMSLQTLAESSRVITPPGASTAKNWSLKGVNHV